MKFLFFSLLGLRFIPVGVTIILALVGWIVALVLQNKNSKDQITGQIKYDLYKEAVGLHQMIQDHLSKLTTIYPPFTVMDGFLIGVEHGLKSRVEALSEGWDYWNGFISSNQGSYFKYTEQYIKFLYLLADWAGPLHRLEMAKKDLDKRIAISNSKIYDTLSKLQLLSSKLGFYWDEHDRGSIEEGFKLVRNESIIIQLALYDFVVLVHNELMADYFKYLIPTREPEDPMYEILTEDGFLNQGIDDV